MLEAFSAAMDRLLIRAGNPGKIVAAFSGGMDSSALVHLLAAWRDRLPSPPALVAAHLNHGLRGEASREDGEFCRRRAGELGLDFACRDADAAGAARREGLNLEEAGRRLRYRFFLDLAASGSSLVLTGHHADDQAETILMHLRRGAHRRGLAGMREFSLLPVPPEGRLLLGRPLLGIGRERLAAYAAARNLAWREDASNRDAALLRNRIRLRTAPFLERLMPGFRERLLARAAAWAREEEELAGAGERLARRQSRREAGGRFFRLGEGAREDPERLAYAFRQVLEEETGARLADARPLGRLAELAAAGKPGATLSLPGRLLARRERDGLFFFFRESADLPAEAETLLPEPPFSLAVGGLEVSAEWLALSGLPPPADRRDPEVEWLRPAAVRWPLCLRAPRPGERFQPLGAPGSRRIQDILVDLKVPRHKRGRLPALSDQEGVLWLWRCRLAQRAALDGQPLARALRISIRPGAPED